ncbi:Hepatic lectin, partial [Varanus komodoensis]
RHCIQGSIFYIYVLLGVSCLLSAIFLIVAVSKATSLSSELSTMNTERPKPKPGLDHEFTKVLFYYSAFLVHVKAALLHSSSNQCHHFSFCPVFPCGPETRQWEYFNGKCYYFSYEKTSWMQAKVQCEDRQSMLVIVNDMPEQNFLQTRTRNERYWIGLHDRDIEGHWRWIDGTSYFSGF